MRTRGGRARAFCCVTSRRPASPPLARTHARSFSVLAPLFLHFPLLPDRRSRSLRAVHSGDPGRARRRLREARRGRDREENAESPPEKSRLPSSCHRRGPPTRAPVPLPRSRCECDTRPREGRPGGRPRPRRGLPGSCHHPSPAFGPFVFLSLVAAVVLSCGRSSILVPVTVGGWRTFFLQMSSFPTSEPSLGFPAPEIPLSLLLQSGSL